MAQIIGNNLSLREEAQQAFVESLQLRNEAHRASEEACVSAEAAKSAAE